MVVRGKGVQIKRSSHQRPNLLMQGCAVGYLFSAKCIRNYWIDKKKFFLHSKAHRMYVCQFLLCNSYYERSYAVVGGTLLQIETMLLFNGCKNFDILQRTGCTHHTVFQTTPNICTLCFCAAVFSCIFKSGLFQGYWRS